MVSSEETPSPHQTQSPAHNTFDKYLHKTEHHIGSITSDNFLEYLFIYFTCDHLFGNAVKPINNSEKIWLLKTRCQEAFGLVYDNWLELSLSQSHSKPILLKQVTQNVLY